MIESANSNDATSLVNVKVHKSIVWWADVSVFMTTLR